MAVYANDKVTKFGELALARLTNPSTSVYSPGTVSLDALRDELKTERAAVVAGSKDMSLLKPGHDFDAIVALMGYPDEIDDVVESHGRHVRVHVHVIRLHYYGHGQIEIENQFTQNWGWRITEMWLDVPNNFGPYTGDVISASDAALIFSTEPMGLRKLAKRLVTDHMTDTAILDRAAERTLFSMASHDEFELDALAYFCRLLGDSGNKKYRDILAKIASNADDQGLKKYAKVGQEKLEAL
jgi:hypothetical protein